MHLRRSWSPPRRDAYAEASEEVFDIFRRYTPLVEPLSLDEAFLDVTASQSLFGDGEQIAGAIKRDVRQELQLVASAGVAPSKFVAKVASDSASRTGCSWSRQGEEAAFLGPLPIERMWGVGPKTAPKLHALGYRTLGDLTRASTEQLERVLGRGGRRSRGSPSGKTPATSSRTDGEVDRRRGDLRRGPRRPRPCRSQLARACGARRPADGARRPVGADGHGEDQVRRFLHPARAA